MKARQFTALVCALCLTGCLADAGPNAGSSTNDFNDATEKLNEEATDKHDFNAKLREFRQYYIDNRAAVDNLKERLNSDKYRSFKNPLVKPFSMSSDPDQRLAVYASAELLFPDLEDITNFEKFCVKHIEELRRVNTARGISEDLDRRDLNARCPEKLTATLETRSPDFLSVINEYVKAVMWALLTKITGPEVPIRNEALSSFMESHRMFIRRMSASDDNGYNRSI